MNPNSGNYNSGFLEINYTVVLFIVMYFSSHIAWVLEDLKNPTVKKWAKYFNSWFFNDGLFIVAMFQLLPLVNQAFLIYNNWDLIEPLSQFYATNVVAVGLGCVLLILVGWFKQPHLRYQNNKPHIIPYDTLM